MSNIYLLFFEVSLLNIIFFLMDSTSYILFHGMTDNAHDIILFEPILTSYCNFNFASTNYHLYDVDQGI